MNNQNLHPKLERFIQQQNQRWEEQDKRWEEQIKFNQEVKQFIVKQEQINEVLLSSIKEILLRLERIESLPTIQKELKELK